MLRTLHVQNFVLIEDQTIDFEREGFCAFTGETGAGKSLLVDALGLLLGERAQKESVRHGAKEAAVSATFDVSGQERVLATCEAHGFELDEGELSVRRVVSADGRSKVFIAGRLSTAGELQQMTSHLISICGQNAQYELVAEDAALEALDRYAGAEVMRAAFAAKHAAYKDAVSRRQALEASEAQRLQRLDYVSFQVQELEEASPRVGEEALVRAERNRLAYAERLRTGLGSVVGTILNDDDAVSGRVGAARRVLRDLVKFDPTLEDFASRLESLGVELDDLGRSCERALEGLNADPEELDRLEARLSLLQRLAKKHGVGIDELPQRWLALSEEKRSLTNADEERSALDKIVGELAVALVTAGAELSGVRMKAAQKFQARVTQALRPLAMPKADFFVQVESTMDVAKASSSGFDRVCYAIMTNPGEPVRPLAKSASGGELSRLSLALQSVLGAHSDVPTFVFDEVDAGIGGATAEIVGQTLAALGAKRQVLCVTHSPQVAAVASRHFRVEKQTAAGRTHSSLVELKTKDRSEELARMLGGVEITDAVRTHAEELLARPQPSKDAKRKKERPSPSA
jgi:DNA repair protein RecN (Recombination protein N)